MCSELAVGHHRTVGGDVLAEVTPIPGGLLGADYEVANGRYRFRKVFGGLNWNPELRAPLSEPGVEVKAGEYLLAVNGKDLAPPENLYARFEATAGKIVEITVGPSPDGKGSRTRERRPRRRTRRALRNRDWVEGNLAKVEKATGGRVAYVYVPNTAEPRPHLLQALLLPAGVARTRSSSTSGSTAAGASPTTTSRRSGASRSPGGRCATART